MSCINVVPCKEKMRVPEPYILVRHPLSCHTYIIHPQMKSGSHILLLINKNVSIKEPTQNQSQNQNIIGIFIGMVLVPTSFLLTLMNSMAQN